MKAGDSRSILDTLLAGELETLERAGLRRRLRSVERLSGGEIVVNGRRVVDFASNDYLGLAADPRIAAAARAALDGRALGAGAARLITGNSADHVALEEDLARFKAAEAALLFGSGYLANLGAIPALAGRRDVIYADQLNHASLIDGCRLSRAEVRVFPHRDIDALRRWLEQDRGRFRRRWIVVDAVFSMDGDVFPLDELVRLARTHGAFTYVDDAHGTGVLGASGRGSAEHFGVVGEVDVTMATLGKALGTSGAFIVGSRPLIDLLLHRARAFVFTTGTPPALAAAAREALRIVHNEPERRELLLKNARKLSSALSEVGFATTANGAGHIVPVLIGPSDQTARAGDLLLERGFAVGAVRPPTVALGTARLRITVSAAHTATQIEALVSAIAEVLPTVLEQSAVGKQGTAA
jgi:8-amino-7-oxononanoate synthase